MKSLTIDEMLTAPDKQTMGVEVPEWNGIVHIRSLSADERDQWEAACQQDKKGRARLIAMSLCDPDGKPQEVSEVQIAALGGKSVAAMERIFDAILELNKMRQADTEAAAKNSQSAATEPG